MRRANIVNVAGRGRIWRLLAMAVLIVSALALSGGDSRAQEPPADNITVTDTSISFSWTEHGSVVFYWHQYPNGRVKLFNDQAVQFSGKSFTISGLTPATTYRLYFYQTFYGELIVETLPQGITTTSEISISGGTTITEGGNATFTLTASPAPAASLDVNVSPLQSGDWGINSAKQTVTIPTTGSATLTLATTNDAIDEADGSVTATIISGTGYTASTSNGSATVQVSDDDVPELSIAAGPAVTEANDATFTVTATPAPHAPLSVSVAITESGGFASPGAQTITIPTSGTTTLTVATIGDKLDEPDGSVTATLAAGTGYTLSSPAAATVNVSDDDDPEVSITGGADITEGGSASFALSISPTQATATNVTVTVSQSGDFASVGQQTVAIPASGSTSFAVATIDDSADEPDGSVTATIVPGAGYAVSTSAGAATVNVADDDDPPQPQEDSQTCTPTLPSNAVTVTEVTGWRDAHSQNADHVLRWNKVLVALGEDVGDSTIKATTVSEAQANKDKYIGDRWTRVTATLQALAQCASSDTTADPEISVTGGSDVTEGGNAIFTLTATPAPTSSVDVSVEVTQYGDYTSQTGAQTVTISDTGTASLVIGTTDDATDEADGSVTATISTGTGYTVSSTAGAATVNVADDDVTQQQTNNQPTITIGDASANEGDTITFTVSVSPAHTAAIALDYETKDRSAISHPDVNDYTAASGTVTIPANSGSATITVTTIEDTDIEIDDEFKLVLSGTLPTGVVMGNDTATGTITNDDEGSRGKERYIRINAQTTKHQYIRLDSNPSLHHMWEGPECIGECPEERHLRLDSQPHTTVTLQSYVANAAIRRHFSVTPEYLTFTTTNWNIHQTVTLSYKGDFNRVSEQVSLRMRSMEDPGATVLNSHVWVYVFDLHLLSTVSQQIPEPNTLTEGDSSSSVVYKLKLDAMPLEEIDVTITNPDSGAVTVTPMTATFDHTNWNEFREFTITPVDDADKNNEEIQITVKIDVPGSSNDITKRFKVRVVDSNADPAVLVSPTELLISEGKSRRYDVSLATDPGAGKSVTIAPTTTGNVQIKPASLTFTGGSSGNWSIKQQFLVETSSDSGSDHHSITITHAASGDSDDYPTGMYADSVSVGVIDDSDPVQIEFDRDNNLVLDEGDATGVPIRVRLSADPTPFGSNNNQVVLQTHPTGTDLVATPTTLTFTGGASGNWNDWQTLTIVPATGKLDDGNTVHDRHWVKVSLGMAPHQIVHLPGYPDTHHDVVTRPIDIFYFDDEIAGDLVLEHSTIDLSEDAKKFTYKLSLASDPGGPVTVNITNPDSTKLTISPETVTFTHGGTGTWYEKEITIKPVPDTDSDDENLQVVHTYNFGGTMGKTQSMQVNIKDAGEPLTLVYSTPSLHIDEYWETDLSTKTDDEIAAIEAGQTELGIDRSLNPSERTDYPQFCVKLNRDPGVNVTVQMPTKTFRSELGKTPRYWFQYEPSEYIKDDYTFTPGDSGTWNTDACFIANAWTHRDQYHVNKDLSPTLNTTAKVRVPKFTLRISDNYWNHVDVIVPGGAPISITEGGAAFTYNVQISQAGSDRYASPAKVTITVPEEHRDAIRVWPSEFTVNQRGSYGGVQKIRVRALPDNDLVNEQIVLTHTVSGMDVGAKLGDAPVTKAIPYEVTVNVTDVASIPIDMEVGPSGLFLVEESFSDNILVRLQSDPINTVTVTANVPQADRSKVRILPDKLTFDSSNYNTFQRFSVEVLSDTDKSNDKVTVTISATGAGLVIPDVTIDADIVDDD